MVDDTLQIGLHWGARRRRLFGLSREAAMTRASLHRLKSHLKALDSQVFGDTLSRTRYRTLRALNSITRPHLPRRFGRDTNTAAQLSFFRSLSSYLALNRLDGHYLEFGVHEANTFRMALNILGPKYLPFTIWGFWAFDSFEGMPAPEGIDLAKIWRE